MSPKIAWKTYLHYFRNPIARAKPNAGHIGLAEIEKMMKMRGEGYTLKIITQNVDALHQRAGSTEVYELHGTVYRHVCSKNKHLHQYQIDVVGLDASGYNPEEDEFFKLDSIPTCQESGCGSYLRPDAVLFTEGLPAESWRNSERAINELKKDDLLIVIGTSGVVYPAASIPQEVAASRKTNVIEINPERSALTHGIEANGGIFLPTTAATVVPKFVEYYEQKLAKA